MGGADVETTTNPEPGDNEAPEPEQQQPAGTGEERSQPSFPEKPNEEVAPEGQEIQGVALSPFGIPAP
jgi:hypothetical protein